MSPLISKLIPLALAVSLTTPAWAEESGHPATGTLGGTTLNGSVDGSAGLPPGSVVPEPGPLALLAGGAALLLLAGRRPRRRQPVGHA